MCFWKKTKKIPEIPGAIPSLVDTRDILLSSVQISLPLRQLPKNYLVPYILRISDQINTPHCVGYSAATIKEEKEMREQRKLNFDGDWLYRECKKIDNYDGPGTYLRTVMKVLKSRGAKPLNENETEAVKYKIGGYAKIDSLIFEELKSAIYQNGVIQLGFHGSNQGWRTAYIRSPKNGERIWGHAVTAIGFNEKYIIGQNSWGEDWGDNGLFYIPKTYRPFEAWAILVDLPKDFVQQKKPVHEFKQNLKLTDKNNEVKQLQICLKYLGVFPQIIECTGYFGPVTLCSAQLFQQSYNITPISGYVGPLTRNKLNEIFK